jgi:hypothetical protein
MYLHVHDASFSLSLSLSIYTYKYQLLPNSESLTKSLSLINSKSLTNSKSRYEKAKNIKINLGRFLMNICLFCFCFQTQLLVKYFSTRPSVFQYCLQLKELWAWIAEGLVLLVLLPLAAQVLLVVQLKDLVRLAADGALGLDC